MTEPVDPRFARLLQDAARLQQVVPDAILVGGSAAALHARHRVSYDHDHVVADLSDRFDVVLEALEREPEWVMNRAVPGKIVLGELGGIETGVRQMIRARPLETETVTLPGGEQLVVPTLDETLRIKAFLIVRRNQVRDYLDVAALADRAGIDRAAQTLAHIDDYYADQAPHDGTVAAQVLEQLADLKPKDSRTIGKLSDYKGLRGRWRDWDQVTAVCRRVAERMLTTD